jgi:hypothetical protein
VFVDSHHLLFKKQGEERGEKKARRGKRKEKSSIRGGIIGDFNFLLP